MANFFLFIRELDNLLDARYLAAFTQDDGPAAQVHREAFVGASALVTASKQYHLRRFVVLLRGDCRPALAALRKVSFCSPILQDIAIGHAEFCMQLKIDVPLTLFAPGLILKAEGIDGLSREVALGERSLESTPALRSLAITLAAEHGWTLTVDLFAASENTLLPRFVSRYPDRHAEAVDALSVPSWRRSRCPHCRQFVFLFPPPRMWPAVLCKAKADGARGVLVAPFAITGAVWPALITASLTRPASRDRCVVVPPAATGASDGPRWAVLAFDFSPFSLSGALPPSSPVPCPQARLSPARCAPSNPRPTLPIARASTAAAPSMPGPGESRPPRPSPSDALRPAFQGAAILALGAGFGAQIRWSRAKGMPTIANLADLRASDAFLGLDMTAMLHNASDPTPLEAADGNWRSVRLPPGSSLADKVTLFNQFVWPARLRPSTRSKHWRYWSTCVTWAPICQCVRGGRGWL